MVETSCSKAPRDPSAAENKTLYTCGMHPQVIQDKPGNCPICGMKLVPIQRATHQASKPSALPSEASNGMPAPESKGKIKYYQSSMMPEETSPNPGKDSMGMEMVPIYEGQQPSKPQEQKPAAAPPGQRKIKYYKSTMLLGEISQTPRKDSMGMDMVPVYEDEAAGAESSSIQIDPVTIQNMGVRTSEVKSGPLRRVITTVGIIDYNETALSDVTVRYKGWIEKLYVDATGKAVKKGEPLLEIYSPDLITAQNEYLLALQAGPSSTQLKESALLRLRNFDISEEQIAELQRTRKVKRTLQVTSPRDGVVVEKMAVEGQMADAGMKLYRIADLSLVWVQSQIYENDLGLIKLGQEAQVSLSYLPDRNFSGRVTYIYPSVDEKTRTGKIRMEFHNPGLFLKPGMFAKVKLFAELEESAVLVPDSAVLRSGDKNTVFVALEGGRFDPRTVVLGPRSEGGYYKVVSGVKAGERVVVSGQFMMDSESQLKEAIQKMLEPAAGQETKAAVPPKPDEPPQMPTGMSQPSPQPAAPEPSHWVCPMPEHSTILYDHAGKCPICGMTLIPDEETKRPESKPGGHLHQGN